MSDSEYIVLGRNTRYIKTKVNGIPKTLHLLTCNLCPLLVYDSGPKVSRCAKYKGLNNVTCSYVHSFSMMNDRILPLQEIPIPEWCGLCKDVMFINKDGNMYVRNGHNSYETIPDINRNLVVMSSAYVEYDLKLQELVSGSFKNAINFTRSGQRALPERTTTPITTKTYTNVSTCSCCGKLLEDVDRKKNYGMCTKCWEENKNNENIKYFAYINNFRLKRASSWSEEIHKKIKEID